MGLDNKDDAPHHIIKIVQWLHNFDDVSEQ